CHQITAGAPALSAVTAATGTTTIASGNNPITWNWAQTTDSQDAFTFGETSAATGGTLTGSLANQAELHVSTASASTASPFEVDQGSVTGTVAFPALQVETTWNNAGLTGQGIVENVTNTASVSGSKLINLLIGGTTHFNYGTDDILNLGGSATIKIPSGSLLVSAPTNFILNNGNGSNWSVAETSGRQVVYNGMTTSGNGLASVQNGIIHSTGNTAAIGTATLCASADCPAGQYHLSFAFIETGTACGTPGTGGVTFLLTWTDTNATA